jgi:hypothetical protein
MWPRMLSDSPARWRGIGQRGHSGPRSRGGQQVLEELRAVNELVTAKATPEEVEAFGRWLLAAAQAAASAGKEGGFLGFGPSG